jgi:hypothetical protein
MMIRRRMRVRSACTDLTLFSSVRLATAWTIPKACRRRPNGASGETRILVICDSPDPARVDLSNDRGRPVSASSLKSPRARAMAFHLRLADQAMAEAWTSEPARRATCEIVGAFTTSGRAR